MNNNKKTMFNILEDKISTTKLEDKNPTILTIIIEDLTNNKEEDKDSINNNKEEDSPLLETDPLKTNNKDIIVNNLNNNSKELKDKPLDLFLKINNLHNLFQLVLVEKKLLTSV
jgi:hypothetical protein